MFAICFNVGVCLVVFYCHIVVIYFKYLSKRYACILKPLYLVIIN